MQVGDFLVAVLAVAVHLHLVTQNAEVVFCNLRLEFFHGAIDKLDDLAAVYANGIVLVLVAIKLVKRHAAVHNRGFYSQTFAYEIIQNPING